MFEHGLDYSLYVIIGYFLLRGLFRGVVKEIVAVLGIFVAFWVASLYWPLGEEHLKAIFDQPGQRGVISFIVIFVVVYFLVGVISIFFDKIVKMTISPVLSSLFGGVVGVIKGILFCAVLLVVAEAFLKPGDKFFASSQWWPHIQPVTNQAKAWMPEKLQELMGKANRYYNIIVNGQGGRNADAAQAPAVPPPALESVDWAAIKNLLDTRAGEISPAWRDKLRGISGPEALSKEDIKKFIEEHPGIFSRPSPAAPVGAPAAPPGQTGAGQTQSPAGGTAPSWPQPATE